MHMHIGHRVLHGLHDVDVRLPGVFGMNPALHAHLGAAPLPCLDHAPLDFLVAQVIGATA